MPIFDWPSAVLRYKSRPVICSVPGLRDVALSGTGSQAPGMCWKIAQGVSWTVEKKPHKILIYRSCPVWGGTATSPGVAPREDCEWQASGACYSALWWEGCLPTDHRQRTARSPAASPQLSGSLFQGLTGGYLGACLTSLRLDPSPASKNGNTYYSTWFWESNETLCDIKTTENWETGGT